MTRNDIAELKRQAILDYVNANPGATTPQIIAAIGSGNGFTDRLRTMVEMGELARVPVVYIGPRGDGFKAKAHTYAYTALVKTTKTAADVRAAVASNYRSTAHKTRVKKQVAVKVGRDENRPPIRGQGGQGALRHEIRRGCSLS